MVEKIGKWAFLAGLVLAAVATAIPEQTWTLWVLALIGLLVGFLNVAAEESHKFLIAAIGLILAARSLEVLPVVGEYATSIVSNVVAFLGAAVLVVALKTVIETARD